MHYPKDKSKGEFSISGPWKMSPLLRCNCKIVVRSWIYFALNHCSIRYRYSIEREEHRWLSTTNEWYFVSIQKMDPDFEDVF